MTHTLSFSYFILHSAKTARWRAGRMGCSTDRTLARNTSPCFPRPTHFLTPWRVVVSPTEFTPVSGKSWPLRGRWGSLPRRKQRLRLILRHLNASLSSSSSSWSFLPEALFFPYPELGKPVSPAAGWVHRGQHRAQSQQADPRMPRTAEEDGAGGLARTVG